MFTQFSQYSDIGLFLLRVAIAIVFLYHGFPKLTKAKAISAGMGASAAKVFIIGLAETFSSLLLIVGFYTQLAALLLCFVMIGAISMKMMKWKVPFSAMDKTGWEFDFILFFASIAILFSGGGLISLLNF